MRLYLDRAKDQLEYATKARDAGDFASAKRHFSQAAQYMLQAAELSPDGLKQPRVEAAKKMLGHAETMDAMAKQKQTGHKAAIPTSDDEGPSWLVQEKPDIQFDDVAGLDDVKEQIRLKLIYPFSHQDKAEYYGIGSGGGILLYGPPGTGKTLIARATAGELEAEFFVAKPSDLLTKWVGDAEQNVHRLFEAARASERAVIFLDEVESMLPKRRGNISTVMKRVVPQFLAELEGFGGKANNVLFIGATNEPWALDPAVMRPGRFDAKIYVPLPDMAARHRILELNLSKRPLADDVSLDDLAERLQGYSGADVVQVCHRASTKAFMDAIEQDDMQPITVADFKEAMVEVKPSVSLKDLQRFEKFAEGG